MLGPFPNGEVLFDNVSKKLTNADVDNRIHAWRIRQATTRRNRTK